jgi:hypothetical protein
MLVTARQEINGLVWDTQVCESGGPSARMIRPEEWPGGKAPVNKTEGAFLMDYRPAPIETSKITLPPEIRELTERLAENAHDIWAEQRMAEGWRLGAKRDDARKEHPCLVPYADLPESEKEYDRRSAMETLKAILALGYRIVKP